jgi:hypothetical protein
VPSGAPRSSLLPRMLCHAACHALSARPGRDTPLFIVLGVFGPDQSASGWSTGKQVHAGRRVTNLSPADFAQDAELTRSLVLAIESIAKLIALRKLGEGE